MSLFAKKTFLCAVVIFMGVESGCRQNLPRQNLPITTPVTLNLIDVNDSMLPVASDQQIGISAAKNEWTSLALQVGDLPQGPRWKLRVNFSPAISTESVSAYQALTMPVDTNRAGYLRQTGLPASERELPRALLPMHCDNGEIDLRSLRPSHSPGYPIIWIDLHVPENTTAGDYAVQCQVTADGLAAPAATLVGTLHVFDFAIPENPHLLMVSELGWDRLESLYPDAFEAITPRLMNRGEDKYAAAISVLDQLVGLAQANRVEVVVPRLQPTVKWLAAERPAVDWSDFDTVVSPWLNGDGFADKTPLGFWPLPRADFIDDYDPASQREYWSNAATHFNGQDWLEHSAVTLFKRNSARARAMESIQYSMLARSILEAHPLLRAILPLEDSQVQFASSSFPMALAPEMAGRIAALAPGLVFGPAAQSWPSDVRPPEYWLDTEAQGLVPYIGAGMDQRDVRLWAWLAYLRRADLVYWAGALPDQDDPSQPANPGKLTWFYPGSWFGVDGPVPSIQLKWLRRAEEDFEYLLLAEERGMRTNGFLLARLLTRQVELQPTQSPDAEYGLLSGTIDQATWDDARQLLARSILARPPESLPDDPAVEKAEQRLNLDMIRWQAPRNAPTSSREPPNGCGTTPTAPTAINGPSSALG